MGCVSMDVTIYVLNTSNAEYQHKQYQRWYSQQFKHFCIAQHTGCNMKDITLHRGEYGKPLITTPSQYYFNTSHTSGYSVCIVSDYNVGVDIEKIAPIDLSIPDKYFAVEEAHYIRAGRIEQQLLRFYELWTLKECYLKLIGTGLYKSLDSFAIVPGHKNYSIKDDMATRPDQLSVFSRQFNRDYRLSIIMDTATASTLNVEITNITPTFNKDFIL